MDGVCSQRGALDHISGVNALPKKNIAGSGFFWGDVIFFSEFKTLKLWIRIDSKTRNINKSQKIETYILISKQN